MADDPPKPEPPPQADRVISLEPRRDQECRRAAARRLAERHNAALRPPAPEDAACMNELFQKLPEHVRIEQRRGVATGGRWLS
jgi:hypothetical protein